MRDKRKTHEIAISTHQQSMRLYRCLRLSRTHDIQVNASSDECRTYLESLCQHTAESSHLSTPVGTGIQRHAMMIKSPRVEPAGEGYVASDQHAASALTRG